MPNYDPLEGQKSVKKLKLGLPGPPLNIEMIFLAKIVKYLNAVSLVGLQKTLNKLQKKVLGENPPSTK